MSKAYASNLTPAQWELIEPLISAAKPRGRPCSGKWKNENFASLDILRKRVHQELKRLSVQQVQSLNSFDFILDVLVQAAF